MLDFIHLPQITDKMILEYFPYICAFIVLETIFLIEMFKLPTVWTYISAKKRKRHMTVIMNPAGGATVESVKVKNGDLQIHGGSSSDKGYGVRADPSARIMLPGNVPLWIVYEPLGYVVNAAHAIACHVWDKNGNEPPTPEELEDKQGNLLPPEEQAKVKDKKMPPVEVKKPTVIHFRDVEKYEEYNSNPMLKESSIQMKVAQILKQHEKLITSQVIGLFMMGMFAALIVYMFVVSDAQTAYSRGESAGYNRGLKAGRLEGMQQAIKAGIQPFVNKTPTSTPVPRISTVTIVPGETADV